MMPSNPRSRLAALVGTLLLGACAGATTTPATTSPQPAVAGAATVSPRHTEADVRFMTAMIAHHAQAIEMARLAPARSESESVRTLAARIINAQRDEIVTMQQWLADRGEPVPQVGAAHGGGGHAGHEMPGLITEAQMRQLEQARGAEFDQLFLRLMIQHHRGAVAMVTELLDTYGAAQDEAVFKIASDVHVDQTTEIARMQRMLLDLMVASPAP